MSRTLHTRLQSEETLKKKSQQPITPSTPSFAIQRAQSAPASLTPAEVMTLQRQIGNRATSQLIRPTMQTPTVQTKLQVGPAGDKYEQEADQMAQQVMRQIDNAPSTTLGNGGYMEKAVQRQEIDEEVQRMPLHGLQGGEVEDTVGQQIQAARGSGQPLENHVRRQMERGFGANFDGVRVHTGQKADMLSRSLNARAFTIGKDLFFKQGEYNPTSSGGKQLLAHELTHTIQQGGVQQGNMPQKSAPQGGIQRAWKAPANAIQRDVLPTFDEVLENPEYQAHFRAFAEKRFSPESLDWPLAEKAYAAKWEKVNSIAHYITSTYHVDDDAGQQNGYTRNLFDPFMKTAAKTNRYDFFKARQEYQAAWDSLHEHVQTTYDKLLQDTGQGPVVNVTNNAIALVNNAIQSKVYPRNLFALVSADLSKNGGDQTVGDYFASRETKAWYTQKKQPKKQSLFGKLGNMFKSKKK